MGEKVTGEPEGKPSKEQEAGEGDDEGARKLAPDKGKGAEERETGHDTAMNAIRNIKA